MHAGIAMLNVIVAIKWILGKQREHMGERAADTLKRHDSCMIWNRAL
jgi:hypothetical protein